MYFISMETFNRAKYEAEKRGIPLSDWIFVPVDPDIRFMMLSGKINIPQHCLIGNFSEEEIERIGAR